MRCTLLEASNGVEWEAGSVVIGYSDCFLAVVHARNAGLVHATACGEIVYMKQSPKASFL
jgi:hypothetical protein